MKNRLYALSIIVMLTIILWSVTFKVNAHPGRTDGNGGHTNRSTGEYHYHHGQPAHDHYDIDGDGDIDCPYDFKDNAEHQSDSAGTISNSVKKGEVSFWHKLVSIVATIGTSILIGMSITIMLFQLLNGILGLDFNGATILFAFIGISVVIYIVFYPIT